MEFNELKEKFKKVDEDAGKKPKLMKDMDVVSWYINQANAVMSDGTIYRHNTYCSAASIDDLKPIHLSDMITEFPHKGRYLLLQTWTPGRYGNMHISSIAADPTGKLILINLYFYVKDTRVKAESALPMGSILLIKEPHMRAVDEGYYHIRCDTPTDVVAIYKNDENWIKFDVGSIPWKMIINDVVWNDPVPRSALQWKARGNELYLERKFPEALRAYQQGVEIALGTDLEITLRLNASATMLALEKFDDALMQAQKVVEICPDNEKALSRASKALSNLQRFEEALEYLTKLCQLHPSASNQQLLADCQDRLSEKAGKIDLNGLRKKLKNSRSIDHADYVGPIKFVTIPGKGRAVVAKEDLPPGTILLVCKSLFSMQQNEMTDREKNVYEAVIYEDKLMELQPSHIFAMRKLIHKLINNPSLIPQVKKLHAGEDDKDPLEPNGIDSRRIGSILRYNAFSLEDGESVGLFVKGSFFNHSCVCNVQRTNFADVLIFQNDRKVMAGEELTVTYTNVSRHLVRRKLTFSTYGFVCSCPMCLAQKEDAALVKIMEEFEQVGEKKGWFNERYYAGDERNDIVQVKQYLSKVKKRFEKIGQVQYRLCIFRFLLVLGNLYGRIGEFRQQYSCMKEQFKVLQFDIDKMFSLGVEKYFDQPDLLFIHPPSMSLAVNAYFNSRIDDPTRAKAWKQLVIKLAASEGYSAKDAMKLIDQYH